MSLKKIFILSMTGFALGGLGTVFYQHLPSRGPASSFPAPKLRLKPWSESLVGKAHQAVAVKISPVGGIPNHDNQELHLKAEVSLSQPMDGEVHFQWSLPSDVSIVSGELEDVWTNLKPGQVATAELTVLNVSKESITKTISMHVSGSAGGVQYAGSGSFATNSLEQMKIADDNKISKLSSEDLVLKKSPNALKMEKTHQ